MPSTSISQSAVRRSPVTRHRGTAQSSSGQSLYPRPRQAHARPGGLTQRRAQLEARWRARLERITALSLAYHEEAQHAVPGVTDGRGATSRRARLLARQEVAERQALVEIEAALERIAAGHYGWCEQCGRPIAAALLMAQPQARYCWACGRQSAQRLACV